MSTLVVSAASKLAARTSRRSFLGLSGQMLLALVGGGALLSLMTGGAWADAGSTAGPNSVVACSCSNPCDIWFKCLCSGPRLRKHRHCPNCTNYTCWYTACTNLGC